jgi:putative ABC transport system permease protein
MTRWMGGGPGPPRLAEMLLRLVVKDPESREGILGDLWEEYCEAADVRSQRYATRWYWWSAIRLALRYATAGLPSIPRRSHRRSFPSPHGRGAITGLARDVGYAARGLVRTPGFAAGLALILGLGLGASTTIFSVFDAVVLRPFPFEQPDRLFRLAQIAPQGLDFHVSQPDFVDFRDGAYGVLDLAAVEYQRVAFLHNERLERLSAGLTTSALFRVLGLRPALGRSFTASEGRPGTNASAVILSARLWRSRFGADPDVLGRTLRLDDGVYVVVGVMAEELEVVSDADVWLARGADPSTSRDDHRLQVFGRLRADVRLPDARDEVTRIAADLGERYPASNQGWGAKLAPLTDDLVGSQVRLASVTLLSALALLLLLIGANISNLLLARTTTRQREFGVRFALGAGRWSVMRLLLAEGLLLGLLGAIIGVGLAYVLLPLVARQPELVPRMTDVAFGGRALTFAGVASAGEGLGIGLGSAFQAARWKVQTALSEAGGGTARAVRRYRDILVVGQVALAMALLVAAGLLARSFQQLRGVDPGFQTEGLVTVEVELSSPVSRLELPGRVEEILSGLRNIPGVDAAAGTDMRFFDLSPRNFTELGRMDAALEDYISADWRVVTPRYFETTGVPVRAGHVFPNPLEASGEPVVVVGETLARSLWPERDAVGQQLRWETPDGLVTRVIGVVGDVADVHPVLPQVASAYVSYADVPTRSLTMLLRSDLPPSDLAASVRRRIREVDAGAALSEMRAVRERYVDVLALDRFVPSFLAVVAGVAVILAGLGVYGLVAFTVARRGHEIGIRMALGGGPGSIVGMLFRHGVLLVTAGVVIGAAVALALSRAFSSLLFETDPSDPVTYLAVGVFLTVVGSVATYVPSKRATQVDPMKVLPA